jgi:hypothetical protein
MRRPVIPNIWNFILIALCTAFAFGQSASEKYISLNGNWQFKSESDQKWMEAKVPGDVHLDLLANKVIGERQISVKTSRSINSEDIKVSCMNQILNKHRE